MHALARAIDSGSSLAHLQVFTPVNAASKLRSACIPYRATTAQGAQAATQQYIAITPHACGDTLYPCLHDSLVARCWSIACMSGHAYVYKHLSRNACSLCFGARTTYCLSPGLCACAPALNVLARTSDHRSHTCQQGRVDVSTSGLHPNVLMVACTGAWATCIVVCWRAQVFGACNPVHGHLWPCSSNQAAMVLTCSSS